MGACGSSRSWNSDLSSFCDHSFFSFQTISAHARLTGSGKRTVQAGPFGDRWSSMPLYFGMLIVFITADLAPTIGRSGPYMSSCSLSDIYGCKELTSG